MERYRTLSKAKFKKMAQRRQSAPSIVIRGVLGLPKSPSVHANENAIPYSPNVNSQRLSLKFGSHGATLNLSKRKYVMEGKVQLITGMQTQDRYMFLFTDLLLIAKAKSGSNFKLKYRIRVCELWTASCLDDVCELPKTSDKSFVIGWPTTNFVATFSTPESKELWLSALLKKINEEKEKETPKTITLKIINRDSSNINHIKMIKVNHRHTAKDVVRNAVKEFGFEESEDQYQLWVISKKEGTAYPLIGHENPHAIQVNHVRDFIAANGILPETEITCVAKYENLIEPEIRDRCQFILRNSNRSPKYSVVDLTQKRMSRLKSKTPAKTIFNWARKRSGQRNESSDSGHVSGNSVGSEGTTFFSSSPPSTSPPATPKLFSLPLGQVCDNGELPAPIATMLDILYRKAPHTPGIFRKCPNAKVTRQLKHKLDEEIGIDLEEESIHVVAALVKDFLRNIPDSVLDCTIYQKWTSAIKNSNDSEKLKSVKRLLTSLDACNRVLVRRLAIVLNRIASRADRNNMTANNLALCIAPSLLWPPGPSNQFDAPSRVSEVTDILRYFTEHCDEIFDGIAPTDVDWPPKIELKSDDEEEYEGDNEKAAVDESVSPLSDDIANNRDFHETKEDKDANDIENDVPPFSRSRMTRRQFQRRKTGSRIDTARLRSLSQDSLDKVLMDVSLTSNRLHVDDIMHNGSDMNGSHNIKKRGKGYMSNDSGFTTLSGEEDDQPSGMGRRDHKETAGIPLSSSAGSNLNELGESIGDTRSDLRGLWDPKLLNISNGQIMDDVELSGIKEEQLSESPHDYSAFARRQSQPVMPSRMRRHANSVGAEEGRKIHFPIPENGSRLFDAITSPMIEFGESDEEQRPFARKPPTYYVRLNDRTSNDDHINNNYKEDSLAKEYLRELRRQTPDDVEENIARAVTSSETKKQYMSGVTVSVNDVRPAEARQYRPVTLSIRGLSDTSPNYRTSEYEITSGEFKSVTSPGNTKSFFIGEDDSSDETPDALSSSQEDVFNNWHNGTRSSFKQHRGWDKAESEVTLQAPKTAPLRRKFNSTITPPKMAIDDTFTHENGDSSPTELVSSIQKLTENLQMMPDFRQRTSRIKSVSEEHNAFLGRKKANSVRENRRLAAAKSSMSNHYIKTKSPLKFNDQNSKGSGVVNFEVHNSLSESKSSISDASKSSVESSSRNSLNETPPSPKEGNFDRDVKSRRGRKRYPLATRMSKNSGEINFSKSMPSPDSNSSKHVSVELEKRESSRESVNSIEIDLSRHRDVINSTKRVRNPSPKLNHADISHMAGAVESKIKELSNLCTSEESLDSPESNQETLKISSGTVKSKISAYNHLINTSPSASRSPSHFSHQESTGETSRIKRKVGVTTRPAKFEVTSSPNHRSSPTFTMDHLDIITKTQTDEDNHYGLVIRASPDHNPQKMPQNDLLTVQITSPGDDDNMSDKALHTPLHHSKSAQPVSDNLLYTLSESFAFGNRKSPRSITPNGSPRDSPVFVRRTRAGSRTPAHQSYSPTANGQAERRTRHYSVDRCSANTAKTPNNVHVASWSTQRCGSNREKSSKRLEPPITPSVVPRDKNANDLLPFIGIIQSEESYV